MDPREVPHIDVVNHAVLQGSNPDDYLILRYLAASDRPRGGRDFYELLWSRKNGDSWQPMARITAARFQEGSQYRRWISDVHSFDSITMRLIVKVGEGNATQTDMLKGNTCKFLYSWRELSLRGDDAMEVLYVCNTAVDGYVPRAL